MNLHSMEVLEFGRILQEVAGMARLMENRDTLLAADFPDRTLLEARFDRTGEMLVLISLAGNPPLPDLPPLGPVLDACRVEGSLLSAEELRTAALWAESGAALADYLALPEAGQTGALAAGCRVPTRLYKRILKSITPEGMIDDAAFPELRRIRSDIRREQEALERALSAILHKPANSALFQDKLVTLRDGRSVLPLKSGKKGKLPGVIHGRSASGETMFLEPLEAVERNNRITDLQGEEQACILGILRDFTNELREERTAYLALHDGLLGLDRIAARARFASRYRATRPVIGSGLNLIRARHPLLETTPVPIDIRPGDKRMMIITGPNTGGKTVGLKTAGLLTMMALSGLYIPAEESSSVPDVRDILCDIGDEQSIRGNLSTFSAHISHLRLLLERASRETLILIDEPGAGTDPQEGAALAQAILERLLESGATVLTSTHYHELKYFAFKHPEIVSASVAFDPVTFAPGYTIVTGQPGASRALEIARTLGLDGRVLERASDLLGPESRRVEGVLQALQQELLAARAERYAAESLRSEQEQLHTDARDALAEARQLRDRAACEARSGFETTRLQYQEEMDRLLAGLRAKTDAPSAREVSDWKRQARDLEEKTASGLPAPQPEPRGALPEETLPGPLLVGDLVLIRGINRRGEVASLSNRGKKATVLVSGTPTIVGTDTLTRLRKAAPDRGHTAPRPKRVRTRVEADASAARSLHLDIRGLRYEDALEKIRAFIDDIALGGGREATIIHGKGTGALQQATREALETHPLVASFAYSHIEAGGTGSTVVTLN